MLKILECLENRTLLEVEDQEGANNDNENSYTKIAWDTAETIWDSFIQTIAHPITNGWVGINALNLIFNPIKIAAEFGISPALTLTHHPVFKTAGMATFFALPFIHLASHSNHLANAVQQQKVTQNNTASVDIILGSENASFYQSLISLDYAGIAANSAKIIFAYSHYFKALHGLSLNNLGTLNNYFMTGLAAYTLYTIWNCHVENREIRNTAHKTTLSLIKNTIDTNTPWDGLSQDTSERIDTTRYTVESYSAGARFTTSFTTNLLVTALPLLTLSSMQNIPTKSLSLYAVQLPGVVANVLRLNNHFLWNIERWLGGYPDAGTWPEDKVEALLLHYKEEQAANTLPCNTSNEEPHTPATKCLEAYAAAGNLSAGDLAALLADTPTNGIKLLKKRLGIS